MEFCFEYKIAGVAVTTLVKADCRIVKWDYSVVKEYGALTHIGYGVYVMTEIAFAEEQCRVQIYRDSAWVDCTFGIVTLGHPELNYVSKAAPEITADLDCNSHKLTEVADAVAATDGVNLSQLTAGLGTLSSTLTAYVDNIVANLPTYTLAQSPKMVRFWQGATDSTGRIYNTLLKCVNALTLSGSQYATILIEGLTSYYYLAVAGCLNVNNITIKSLNKNWWIAFADGVKNKTISLEDMKILFGAGTNGGFSGTRTYTNFKFINCDVYCYNNLALYEGEYQNVNFYMATGKTITFYNAGVLRNVKCNSEITIDGSFNGFKDYQDKLGSEFIPNGSMPTDVTVDIIP